MYGRALGSPRISGLVSNSKKKTTFIKEVWLVPSLLPLFSHSDNKFVELISLNQVQPVLSQICDYTPLSVKALLELAKVYLN